MTMRRCPQRRGVRLAVAAAAGAASSSFAIGAGRGPSSSLRGATPDAVADEGRGSSSSDDSSLTGVDGDDPALRHQQARHLRLSKIKNDAKTPREPSAGLVALARLDAGGTTYKQENADHASSASSSFLLGFDGSALFREAAPSSSMANIATTAVQDGCTGEWGDWQGECRDHDGSGKMYRSRIFHLTTKTKTTTVSLPIYNPCMPHENGTLLTGETFFVGGNFNEKNTFWLDSTNKQVASGQKWEKADGAAREDSRKALRDAMADDSKTTFCFGGGKNDQVASLIHLPQEAKQITLVHKAGATAIGTLDGDHSLGAELDKWGSWKNDDSSSISPWIVAGKADTRGKGAPTDKRRDGVAPLRVSYERMTEHVKSRMYKVAKIEWGDELDSWGEQKNPPPAELDTMSVRVRAPDGAQGKSIDFRDGPLSSFPAGDYSVVIGANYFGKLTYSDNNQGVTCVQAIACVADVTERTPATASTASYFDHRRDDNVLTIKVCTTDKEFLGKPKVFTYQRHFAGPDADPHEAQRGGSAWSWKITTEVDSNIRPDFSREHVQQLSTHWDHLQGICIAEVSTEDKVLTKVPFWLDTVCTANVQHDDADKGYYNHFQHEGRVKCWGPVREWGPFFNTRRALSLRTCPAVSGFAGWTSGTPTLTVEITTKGNSKRFSHSFQRTDGLQTAGLETSVLFDSTADGGSPVSIAEEELNSVKLTVAGTNAALCIEQIVYESMVLTNAPLLLDFDRKLPSTNDPACSSSEIKGYNGATNLPGIKQCYTESRVMQVSKSRLELRRCAKGWAAIKGGRIVGEDKDDEQAVKLQFTTRKPGDADHLESEEQVYATWKPSQDSAESLIIPFVESEDVKEIEIKVEDTSEDVMVCISEVKLGVYSEEVVVEKNSFLMVNWDNPACDTDHKGDGTVTRTTLKVSGLDHETTLLCYDRTRRLRIPPRHATPPEQCPHTEDFTARVDCASTSTAITATNWRGEVDSMEKKAQLLESNTAALTASARAAAEQNCC
eukprot:CAMPEP_0178985032 /NCGR_PEP_ID=MMETSP0795-20121207/1935_1 /TAXON_ID=88552 /ORGANISM="Amoebophrya sp., Strain Ameob2" /LENGTH=1009 /DNA_ID=CAMNT_0020675961 /DNA_START=137 /DNA_END=3166 /DNA_ORIENTATION=-